MQRPGSQQTPCFSTQNFYTNAIFGNNTGENQFKFVLRYVNQLFVGNVTATNTGELLVGILQPATFQGQTINLAKYFDGSLQTSNRNGAPAAVNYLDGGGTAVLRNMLVSTPSQPSLEGLQPLGFRHVSRSLTAQNAVNATI